MAAGYTGKILLINLTNLTTDVLNTEQYEEFYGGNGMGSAIFWDLCRDKTISGFDPENIITLTTGPLSGTIAPGASRLEICGINIFSYPVEWFSRSNIGGFFSSMLKYAGWDGIVIKGKAAKPVWVNILNDKVTIEDARDLWGQLVNTAQEEIWRRVTGRNSFGEWLSLGDAQTTQGPSILCIGPGGESLSRLGTIQSGIGASASQGGFGGIWGSKNLKAISVLGTGSIEVADPIALLAARQWASGLIEQKPVPVENGRQVSCAGCFGKCKTRVQGGAFQDAMCLRSIYRTDALPNGSTGSDIISLYGLNMNELSGVPLTDGVYLDKLYKMGVLGPGKRIDSYPLPMEKFANAEYAEALCSAIVNREGIGADLTEGFMRAAEKWNRLEQDLASGWLHKAHWGYGWHWSLPYVEQAYGSLMGDREITEHSFSSSRIMQLMGTPEFNRVSVEKLVEMLSKKTIPYTGDPFMFDYSWQGEDGSNMKQALETGIYSQHKAKFVAWHRHYTRFWAESILYCDRVYPSWFDKNAADLSGQTPESEARFLNAVTGKNLTFADGIKAGRKIWNLNRAIWTLQGRNRNMEKFAEFMYTPEGSIIKSVDFPGLENRKMPVYDHGKWHADPLDTLYLDKNAFEQWKTHYYEFEGWDPETGWPTRGTLEELGLGKVADTLDKAGRLGKSERGE